MTKKQGILRVALLQLCAGEDKQKNLSNALSMAQEALKNKAQFILLPEVFNFGKHKGKTVSEVFTKEPSYYDWMMNGDFPAETKQVLTALRLRNFSGAK